jgi:hypothetical protein
MLRNINGIPLEAVPEIKERPPSTLKMSTAGPLGGAAGDPRAPTINAKNVDDRAPRRRCWRSRSAHHQRKETFTATPLGGGAEDSGAPTINAENIDGGPLRGAARDMGEPTINAKNIDGGPRGPCGGPISIRDSKDVL